MTPQENKLVEVKNVNTCDVNHPARYNVGASTESKGILKDIGFDDSVLELECIKAMEEQHGKAFVFLFCVGNVTKYLWRLNLKGSNAFERSITMKKDLGKIMWYCEYAISLFESTKGMSEHFPHHHKQYEQMKVVKNWLTENYRVRSQYGEV